MLLLMQALWDCLERTESWPPEVEVLCESWPPEVEVQILLDETWLQESWVEWWLWKTREESLSLVWEDSWQQELWKAGEDEVL